MNNKKPNKQLSLVKPSRSRKRKYLPDVSIISSKVMIFRASFLKQAKNEMGNSDHVLLSYSRSLNAIVFKLIKNNDKKAVAFKITRIQYSRTSISLQSFMSFYKLDVKKYVGKYFAKKEKIPGEGSRWVIYLNERNKKPKLNELNLSNNKAKRWFDLEEFSHFRERESIPYVSIIKTKLLVFSVGFLRISKDQIGTNDHVLFYYSKSLNAIVFEFINNIDNVVATKITKTKNLNVSLSAKSFFNFYGINIEKYVGKYLARKEEIPYKGSRWVIYLNEVNDIAKFNTNNLIASATDRWKDLEKFSRFKLIQDLTPYVSIVSSRRLNFSSGFLEHAKNETNNNNYIALLYSKSLNAIVFKFINSKQNGAKYFRKNKFLNGATIHIKSFLIFYKIRLIKHIKKYLAVKEIIPNEGISWVIYLGKTNITIASDNLNNEANRWKDLERFSLAYISIGSSKHMIFSMGFLEQAKNEIGDNDYILPYYSKSLNAIAFEFTSNKQPDSLKISKRSKRVATTCIRSFLNFHKVDVKKYSGKYLAKKEYVPEKGICWVIYLNQKN